MSRKGLLANDAYGSPSAESLQLPESMTLRWRYAQAFVWLRNVVVVTVMVSRLLLLYTRFLDDQSKPKPQLSLPPPCP